MNHAEYSRYYNRLLPAVLGGNHAHFDIAELNSTEKKAYPNCLHGFQVMALIAFIESNFLSSSDARSLRNFSNVSRIPLTVNQKHLSGYYYIRDCFAHNPLGKMFPAGDPNSTKFLNAIDTNEFPYARIDGDTVVIKDVHPLHLIVLGLYEIND